MKLQLTDKVLKLVSKADRQKLGLKTMDEINAAAEAQTERDLHKYIRGLLELRGIEFIESRMDKRTTQKRGVPDFLFTVAFHPVPEMKDGAVVMSWWPIACAWELKLPGRVLDPDQKAMFERLSTRPNCWCCRVIRSVDEALAELKKLGL